MDTERSAITEPVRRIEVFTGAGRRRTWSAEAKARIVAETMTGEESVCAVARRHGLSPQQVFGWRREARRAAENSKSKGSLFVPAIIEPTASPRPRQRTEARSSRRDETVGGIEVEIDGMVVRIGRDADAKVIATVLRALKGGA
ncbi:MAG TPA: transposase [Xanthobacteraceae bacterium]|jgi:transposase|nr:transposase [Xanthobacteraceae bacterium]